MILNLLGELEQLSSEGINGLFCHDQSIPAKPRFAQGGSSIEASELCALGFGFSAVDFARAYDLLVSKAVISWKKPGFPVVCILPGFPVKSQI
jgi:hypothetical protein